ncbi:MAG: hypothetical protein IPN90_02530 [Elusimicrobia bacterium]|nr:hypothetical protein [Elusimicrobiota bacterium]
MSLIKLSSTVGERKFVIQQDRPEVGFYLFVYENNKCVQDHLQDDLETVKRFALEEFSVPYESWRPEEE